MTKEQLKKSILQYAVEGKLVEQKEYEGTAKEILEQINLEKEKLLKSKQIKKDKNESVIYKENGHFYEIQGKKDPICIDDEIPFDVPDNWEWARVASICVLQRGKGIKKSEIIEEGFSCIRYGELYSTYKDFVYSTKSYIEEDLFESSFKIAHDEVLMTLTGENKIDIGCAIANKTGEFVAFGGDMLALREHNMNGSYLVYAINSPCLNSQRTAMATGSIIIHLSASKIGSMLIPIPPLKEQQRIVKKIEELMPLIDQYGEAYDQLELLNKQFPDKLKNSILQYAVEGKLVEQKEEEDTAKELLEQINLEKEKLIKSKQIKRDKNESVIYRENGHFYEKIGKKKPVCIDNDILLNIPGNWEWVRLGDISKLNGGFAFKSSQFKKVGFRVIRISDFNEDGFVDKSIVRYNYKDSLKKYLINKKDILMCMTGGTVGKMLYVENIPEPMLLNQRVACITPIAVNPKYIYNVLSAPLVKNIINQEKNSTNDNISMFTIRNFLIPLPPLKEQQRIVEKIEELYSVLETDSI